MAKTLKIPFIPSETIVTLEVSGYFYKKLQTVLIGLGNQKTPEEFKAILEKLKTEESPADVFEAQVHVMTALIVSIEKAAMEQKVVQYHEQDIDDTPTDN